MSDLLAQLTGEIAVFGALLLYITRAKDEQIATYKELWKDGLERERKLIVQAEERRTGKPSLPPTDDDAEDRPTRRYKVVDDTNRRWHDVDERERRAELERRQQAIDAEVLDYLHSGRRKPKP